MSLTKSFLATKSNIKAKVIADSITKDGKRITTLEVEYPRFMHSEFLTHNSISKNYSSSRAIPVKTFADLILNNMAFPLFFGKNQGGMKAKEEVSKDSIKLIKKLWRKIGEEMVEESLFLAEDCSLHKQIANRITEPFQMIKGVITATDWDNFFNLRLHKDAQPEFVLLANAIYQAIQNSTPIQLLSGEWHTPYVNRYRVGKELRYSIEDEYCNIITLDEETAKKISVSCCAQVSYRRTDSSIEKAIKIYDMLVQAEVIHASPFEHVATPVADFSYIENEDYITIRTINSDSPDTWEKGVTHLNRKGKLCSGNLVEWISSRHRDIQNNTCYDFNYEERLKSFD